MKAAKEFHEFNNLNLGIWPSPPQLLSLRVGDLMRCKFSSR